MAFHDIAAAVPGVAERSLPPIPGGVTEPGSAVAWHLARL